MVADGRLASGEMRMDMVFMVLHYARYFGEAIGVAAEEDQFARAAVAEFTEPFGEGVRIETFSGGVEKDHGSGAIRVEFLQCGSAVADFGNFDRARTADALYIVIEDGAQFGAARFSQHE